MENKIRYHEYKTKQQGKPGSFNKKDARQARRGNTMQDPEEDEVFGYDHIGDDRNNESPTSNLEGSLFEQIPFDSSLMHYGKAYADTNEKENKDKSAKAKPVDIVQKGDVNHSKKMKIKSQMENDHQQHGKAPDGVDHDVTLSIV